MPDSSYYNSSFTTKYPQARTNFCDIYHFHREEEKLHASLKARAFTFALK